MDVLWLYTSCAQWPERRLFVVWEAGGMWVDALRQDSALGPEENT